MTELTVSGAQCDSVASQLQTTPPSASVAFDRSDHEPIPWRFAEHSRGTTRRAGGNVSCHATRRVGLWRFTAVRVEYSPRVDRVKRLPSVLAGYVLGPGFSSSQLTLVCP